MLLHIAASALYTIHCAAALMRHAEVCAQSRNGVLSVVDADMNGNNGERKQENEKERRKKPNALEHLVEFIRRN